MSTCYKTQHTSEITWVGWISLNRILKKITSSNYKSWTYCTFFFYLLIDYELWLGKISRTIRIHKGKKLFSFITIIYLSYFIYYIHSYILCALWYRSEVYCGPCLRHPLNLVPVTWNVSPQRRRLSSNIIKFLSQLVIN